jgi:hypothetical protein
MSYATYPPPPDAQTRAQLVSRWRQVNDELAKGNQEIEQMLTKLETELTEKPVSGVTFSSR